MAPPLLSDADIEAALAGLPDWQRVGDKLRAEFTFDSFVSAFGFMTEVAINAERLFHHPEWSNVYGRVHVVLTTHAVDGLSDLDVKLANKMDGLFGG